MQSKRHDNENELSEDSSYTLNLLTSVLDCWVVVVGAYIVYLLYKMNFERKAKSKHNVMIKSMQVVNVHTFFSFSYTWTV